MHTRGAIFYAAVAVDVPIASVVDISDDPPTQTPN
jgi:hypothetical protein